MYEIIDNVGVLLGPDGMHRLTGIMLDLGNTRRLRPLRRWARIKFVFPIKRPGAAEPIVATHPRRNLGEQDAIPAQRDKPVTVVPSSENEGGISTVDDNGSLNPK